MGSIPIARSRFTAAAFGAAVVVSGAPVATQHKPPTPSDQAQLLLGWREWLGLPGLGIGAIRAKIDSGARSSALHVDQQQCFERDGVEWVRFMLDPGDGGRVVQCEAVVIDRRPVTDSGGHRTERIFIRTDLRLGPLEYPIEINLTCRRNMLFPMLLGRSAMVGHCRIDPQSSFLLGSPEP